MPDIRFLVEMVKGVPVLAAPEEIDIANAGELRRALLESAAYGSGTLVVDLTRTQFCDTAGLHALWGRVSGPGPWVATCCVTPGAGVLRIFAITGLDQVFLSFATLDKALAHIPGGAGGHPAAT
jgi:anti-sigma B factor antagonist